MRKGSTVQVRIDKTEFPSVGVGDLNGRKIYVEGTFPGQLVSGRVKKKREGYAELKLSSVDERADYEIEKKCEHFGLCGGCTSQNLTYERQLDLLSNEVKALFDDANLETGEYLGVVGSQNQWEYRNKMEFTFGDFEKGGELTLGMHMKGKSFGIITVDKCQIVEEDFRAVVR